MDRIAIEKLGIPGSTLMSRAGAAVFRLGRQHFPRIDRWLVLCGAGNNAGDGYVIAHLARDAGLDVTVIALSDPQKLSGDAAWAYGQFREAGGQVEDFEPVLCEHAGLIIDAMLGTGLDRPLGGVYRDAVQAVAGSTAPVIAVDVPTGLNAATGEVMGAAVTAVFTVTFVGLKQGLFINAGPDHAGQVVFDGLGIPPDALGGFQPSFALFEPRDLAEVLAPRPATAHKGLFGHVLVIGGNHGMAGAVRMAGEAALRGGAGLVTVATRPAHAASIVTARPELMCVGVDDAPALAPLLERATVLAIGPGLGRDDWAHAMLQAALDAPQPKVLDADALNLLAEAPSRRSDWVLTPHPGEAARLLGMSTADVQSDRLSAVGALAKRYGGVCVLKGRGTLVAEPDSLPWLIDRGNPGMATAGMGDVLTGVTAALLAQSGLSAKSAAAAVFGHACAGDRAAEAGQRGLLASDLLTELRACLNPS